MNYLVTLALTLAVFIPLVASHGILICPPARDGQMEVPGKKITPRPPTTTQLNACDGTSAGAIVGKYIAGSSINVTWDTTLLHTSAPGVRIAIKYSDADSFNANILAEGVSIGNNGLNYHTVALPAGKTSNNAVLQWVWDSQTDGGYYLGCSDIAIVTAGAQAPVCKVPGGSDLPSASGASVNSVAILLLAVISLIAMLF